LSEVKRRLRELLDIKDEWILAALYSDPRVREINERLVERWERSGMKGDPLDYASEAEARILLHLVEQYAFMSPEAARRLTLGRMASPGSGGSRQLEEDRHSGLGEILRRLLGESKRRHRG